MKKISSIIALALAASVFPAFAQDAPPPACPPAQQQGEWHGRRGPGGPMKEILESLTPAERKQYMQARKKSKDDSAVVEARKKAEVAMEAVKDASKAAMLKADPTIGPVLEKVEAALKEQKEKRHEKREEKRLP